MSTDRTNQALILQDGRHLGFAEYGASTGRPVFHFGGSGSSVRPRIDVWHGEADVNVPIHAAKYLCDLLPHTRATFLPGEGHFFLFNRWEQVLSALVSGNEY